MWIDFGPINAQIAAALQDDGMRVEAEIFEGASRASQSGVRVGIPVVHEIRHVKVYPEDE